MTARFDHLVIAVADLDDAAARWSAAGLPTVRGGAHPVGTENVLVRGPEPAYVELIAAGRDESNPWLDRVRSSRGLISWAVAVDDVDAARESISAAGFSPQPVTEGSRRTPDGKLVAWRMCDVGPGPYDGALPFLIQWTKPMSPGPADGPVVDGVLVTPPDPDRLADLLLALGFVPDAAWPRRVFHQLEDSGGVRITLRPVGAPVLDDGAVYFGWAGPDDTAETDQTDDPATSLYVTLPVSTMGETVLDGVEVQTAPDRRRFAAAGLLPAVDEAFARLRGALADWPDPHPGGRSPAQEEYSRCEDPGRYRLVGARADAWVEAITTARLGTAHAVAASSVQWIGDLLVAPDRVTVLRGRAGTQPLVVAWSAMEGADDAVVQIGMGEPAEVLERQPDCGCDACDSGSADLLPAIDDVFIRVLSGAIHVVRRGDRVVTGSREEWSGSGSFADGEAEDWLDDAAAGRRTDGVVGGGPWL